MCREHRVSPARSRVPGERVCSARRRRGGGRRRAAGDARSTSTRPGCGTHQPADTTTTHAPDTCGLALVSPRHPAPRPVDTPHLPPTGGANPSEPQSNTTRANENDCIGGAARPRDGGAVEPPECGAAYRGGRLAGGPLLRDGCGGSGRPLPHLARDDAARRAVLRTPMFDLMSIVAAVKCNDDKLLVTTLAALGTGFDCASKAEIELVTSIGVRPERIIFANPAKMASHIKYASRAGVDTMTFDSETELMKIKQHMPHAQLVIRIRCDATAAQCPLGIKFGCDPVTEAPRLLKLAAVLGLEVVGVSFHVGSGTQETGVYVRAIQYSRALFSLAANVGHANMRLLDIGGGFPGALHSSIREVSQVINGALETYFSDRSVRVIAEPGRYFAAAAYTLCALVHAKREVCQKDKEGNEESHMMYFINDGVYGSFNCVLYDHQHVVAETLEPKPEKPQPCSVWGPSCDGLDCVLPSTYLPPIAVGEWLIFRDMGAYTLPVASAFNGFPVPKIRAVIDSSVCHECHKYSKMDLFEFLEDELDEYFEHITRPRRNRVIKPRPNYLESLDDQDF
ncbi:unnamed protein product [Diatraea saccharalis]|uniref:Ornithine decarboxylase n=1 Tax=Diatraea saccharalis TaxID=40085 RepID=A0A9N9RAW4_9NEOP|nr:unnamed protein product [Diatraea saccharalis]